MKQTISILFIILTFSMPAADGHAMEAFGIKMHGFISQGYLKSTGNNFFGDTKDGTFDFNEFGINFSKNLTDDLWIGLQVLSKDFGAYGNNDLTLDWAMAGYHWKDWLGLRGGKLKAPKGFHNETRDVDMLRYNILLPQSVYPEILRDLDLGIIGGSIYGDISLNRWGDVSYQFLYGAQNVDPNEAASQVLQGTTASLTQMENDSIDVDKKFAAGLVYDTPINGLRVGVTFDTAVLTATGHFTEDEMIGRIAIADFDKYENSVVSAEYSIGNVVLVAEHIRTKRVFAHEFLNADVESEANAPSESDGPETGGSPDAYDITADGWYAGVSYHPNDWLQLSGYYSASYNDTDDRSGDWLAVSHRAYLKDICLTVGFILGDAWHVKVEGHRFKGTNGVSPLDQVADELGQVFYDESWSLFAAKMTFNF